MPVVLGLCGYATVGKNEAAEGLIALGWQHVAFADGVRELALKCNPICNFSVGSHWNFKKLEPMVREYGWSDCKESPSVRQFLQNVGNSCREMFGENVWANRAAGKILEAQYRNKSVVITDVRFVNEIQAVYQAGCGPEYTSAIVRITRPGVGPVNNHISETAIDDIEADHTIVNDGTPEELQAKLVAYAESLEAVAK